MAIASLRQLKNISGKRALVRVDFNVPIAKGRIKADYKIRRQLPTIVSLLKAGALVTLVSHLGRPHSFDQAFTMRPVAAHLKKLLPGARIRFFPLRTLSDLTKLRRSQTAQKTDEVFVLDNVRFLPGEEKGSRSLAKALAGLADFFVLDGFAVCHRAAASVSGVARLVPSYAGLLLSEEISVLTGIQRHPRRPLAVLIGGAKAETKLPIVRRFLPKAESILLSGTIFNTFLWSAGHRLGASLIDRSFKKEILALARQKKCVWPIDAVVGGADGSNARVVSLDKPLKLGKSEAVYDIGPSTVKLFATYVKKAGTLLVNGTAGKFEIPAYRFGTAALLQAVAARSRGKAFGVLGGGETVEAAEQLGLMEDIDFVSTGGGAMLAFLGGEKLPGLEALRKNVKI